MDAKDISEYVTSHIDELLRLFPNRYACFIRDGSGVKVDASFGSLSEGVSRSDMLYGRGNYLLFHVKPETKWLPQ